MLTFDQAESSLADTREFVAFVRDRCVSSTITTGAPGRPSTSLVQPILTPRFAIACSDRVLTDLGDMAAKDLTLPIQTHLAENPSEVEFAKCTGFFLDSA